MQPVFVKEQEKQAEWSHIGREKTEGEAKFVILIVVVIDSQTHMKVKFDHIIFFIYVQCKVHQRN